MIARHSSELVLGGARSGKSRHAQSLAGAFARVAFVATAEPLDAEMAARIARHRAERPGHWVTVETPLEPAAACRRLAGSVDAAVIDCLTLWVSNRLRRGDDEAAILAGADELRRLCHDRVVSLVIVTNEVGEGVHPATGEGRRFREVLGRVNQCVAAAADRVTLMVAGLPLVVKGAGPAPAATAPEAGWNERAPEAP